MVPLGIAIHCIEIFFIRFGFLFVYFPRKRSNHSSIKWSNGPSDPISVFKGILRKKILKDSPEGSRYMPYESHLYIFCWRKYTEIFVLTGYELLKQIDLCLCLFCTALVPPQIHFWLTQTIWTLFGVCRNLENDFPSTSTFFSFFVVEYFW